MLSQKNPKKKRALHNFETITKKVQKSQQDQQESTERREPRKWKFLSPYVPQTAGSQLETGITNVKSGLKSDKSLENQPKAQRKADKPLPDPLQPNITSSHRKPDTSARKVVAPYPGKNKSLDHLWHLIQRLPSPQGLPFEDLKLLPLAPPLEILGKASLGLLPGRSDLPYICSRECSVKFRHVFVPGAVHWPHVSNIYSWDVYKSFSVDEGGPTLRKLEEHLDLQLHIRPSPPPSDDPAHPKSATPSVARRNNLREVEREGFDAAFGIAGTTSQAAVPDHAEWEDDRKVTSNKEHASSYPLFMYAPLPPASDDEDALHITSNNEHTTASVDRRRGLHEAGEGLNPVELQAREFERLFSNKELQMAEVAGCLRMCGSDLQASFQHFVN